MASLLCLFGRKIAYDQRGFILSELMLDADEFRSPLPFLQRTFIMCCEIARIVTTWSLMPSQ